MTKRDQFVKSVAFYCKEIHELAIANGFWEAQASDVPANVGEKIALIHSEVSEALETLREKNVDQAALAEELADVVIRVMDLSERFQLDLGLAVLKKHDINKKRPWKHGKAF